MISLVLWIVVLAMIPVTLVSASLILGFRIVESGQVAWVFRLGKFVRVLKPGPHFTLALLERVEYHSTQAHQIELPDEPERIDRVNDLLAPGMKHPYRVNHKGLEEAIFYMKKQGDRRPDSEPDSYEVRRFDNLTDDPDTLKELQNAMRKDSLHTPLTGEHAVVVNWQLKQDVAAVRDLIENVSPEFGRNREGEIRKRIEDEVSRVLQEYLVPVTYGHATERIALFSALIRERLRILVGEVGPTGDAPDKPWGIQLGDVFIKEPHPGFTVNKARNAAAAAVSDKQAAISQSEGKRQQLINEAEGDKQARQLKADAAAYEEMKKGEGEAARIQEMAKVMADPNARFLAALDVAETTLPTARPVIIPVGEGSVLSAVLGTLAGKIDNPRTPTVP